MIISDKYNFVYQHISKSAGTFIHHILLKYLKEEVRPVGKGHTLYLDLDEKPVGKGHTLYLDLDEKYKNNDLAISISHPVDKWVSLYCDMCHGETVTTVINSEEKPFYEKPIREDKYGNPSCRSFQCGDFQCGESFEDFLDLTLDVQVETFTSRKKLSDSIQQCKDLGNKVFFIKKEFFVHDFIKFLDTKNIPISNEMLEEICNTVMRKSDNNLFNSIRNKVYQDRNLLNRICQAEEFLLEIYNGM
jgi:hypothetical protein